MKVKGIERTWENGNESITRTLMKKGESDTWPWALGCQHCLLTLAKGPCSGAQCEFEKEVGNTLECDWCCPCLEIRLKVSVMSPIIRQCAGGIWNESETGECTRRCPWSLSSSSCSASLLQAQLECALSAPWVSHCCWNWLWEITNEFEWRHAVVVCATMMYTQSQHASDAWELSLFTCTTMVYTTTSQHRCKFMKIMKGFSPQSQRASDAWELRCTWLTTGSYIWKWIGATLGTNWSSTITS